MKKGKYIYRNDYGATVRAIPEGEGRVFAICGDDYAGLHNACYRMRSRNTPAWCVSAGPGRLLVKRTAASQDSPSAVKEGAYKLAKNYMATVLAVERGEEVELATVGRDYTNLREKCVQLRARGHNVECKRQASAPGIVIIKNIASNGRIKAPRI